MSFKEFHMQQALIFFPYPTGLEATITLSNITL